MTLNRRGLKCNKGWTAAVAMRNHHDGTADSCVCGRRGLFRCRLCAAEFHHLAGRGRACGALTPAMWSATCSRSPTPAGRWGRSDLDVAPPWLPHRHRGRLRFRHGRQRRRLRMAQRRLRDRRDPALHGDDADAAQRRRHVCQCRDRGPRHTLGLSPRRSRRRAPERARSECGSRRPCDDDARRHGRDGLAGAHARRRAGDRRARARRRSAAGKSAPSRADGHPRGCVGGNPDRGRVSAVFRRARP